MKVANRTFIVTGGASGLGKATAANLASHGANVAVFDRDIPAPSSSSKSIKYIKVDVTLEQNVKEALEQTLSWIQDSGKTLGGVVNCSGVSTASKTVNQDGSVLDLDVFEYVVKVNLIGTFNVSRLVASRLTLNKPDKEGERGVIIMVASVAAFEGQTGQVPYSASKGGVVGMTLPMARDLARYGIRVVSIAPGLFETGMSASLPEKTRKKIDGMLEFPNRLGKPEEFGKLVEEIITNPMINGNTIRIDGASRLGKL
ncbi:3-hydroxyacyl-CoA dehydrogenase type-2 [Neolecta irregularis DAH-3]|uniref:3-hydroxyacyl-CoA dehydrogenase type-2 n=1 Tax=Neolecta irregularis (strain DAH-3) TaxID=1198029 RepID=A0A1U7LLP1_NEOID|nr:3-hydroxyacyl-CoA dehydrogenase type-2 [Neolecta irregularis DAH-3]|eukprot:OLL23567.1 3-hydroxyacyl-CoA dehydrogenase type-2 [Neolecta irregularis DAH-3]